jgi:hypothetical protein
MRDRALVGSVATLLAIALARCASHRTSPMPATAATIDDESVTSASSGSSLAPAPPIEDDDERALRDIGSSPRIDEGACAPPVADAEPAIHPDEERVYRELTQLLHAAARVYHFGGRASERCHLVCDGTRVLCGAEALAALRAQWARSHGELTVSRWTGRTMVGVFENYWHVRADGSAVHYYHARTDVAPSRCAQCGWNREVIQGFMRADGTPRVRAPGTSGN